MKPLTMTEDDERAIFEKPRGIPQAREMMRVFDEIDALRARIAEMSAGETHAPQEPVAARGQR